MATMDVDNDSSSRTSSSPLDDEDDEPECITIKEESVKDEEECFDPLIEASDYLQTYQCQSCPKSFQNPKGLMDHISETHSFIPVDKKGVKRTCPECFKELSSKTSLRRHLESHVKRAEKGPIGPPFICKLCDKKYKNWRGLHCHKKSVHEKVKYPCPECPLEFKSTDGLKLHRRSVHLQIKFPCPQCKSVLSSKTVLNEHIAMVHDKVKFLCQECAMVLNSRRALHRHLKKVHPPSNVAS